MALSRARNQSGAQKFRAEEDFPATFDLHPLSWRKEFSVDTSPRCAPFVSYQEGLAFNPEGGVETGHLGVAHNRRTTRAVATEAEIGAFEQCESPCRSFDVGAESLLWVSRSASNWRWCGVR